jgi:hypothetical protein
MLLHRSVELLVIYLPRRHLSYRAFMTTMALLVVLHMLHHQLGQLAKSRHGRESDVFGWQKVLL